MPTLSLPSKKTPVATPKTKGHNIRRLMRLAVFFHVLLTHGTKYYISGYIKLHVLYKSSSICPFYTLYAIMCV